MLRLSLLLVAGIGWLLAQAAPPLSLEYFYQNKFLSNGAEVVFEFKVDNCTPGTQMSGTFDFGDGQSQALSHVNCERWRVPHTYYATASAAKLKLDGLPETSTPVDLAGPPETPPKQLIYSGGGGNPGDTGAKKSTGGGGSQPQSKTYQLILKEPSIANGISGYVAVLGSSDSGFSVQNVKVKPIFLTSGFKFFGASACKKSTSGKCFSWVVELGGPEGCPHLPDTVMAEITVTGNAKLVLDEMDSQDAGPVCHDWVSDNKPIIDISGNFELK